MFGEKTLKNYQQLLIQFCHKITFDTFYFGTHWLELVIRSRRIVYLRLSRWMLQINVVVLQGLV